MQFTYPYETEADGRSLLVHFPDVPGALTQVDPGEDLQELARDCLVAALGGYVERHSEIPRPSRSRGGLTVTLDIMTSAKLALACAMVDAGISNVALAARLGVTEKVVRRLLDPDHASQIRKLEIALAQLDRRLALSVYTEHKGLVQGIPPH